VRSAVFLVWLALGKMHSAFFSLLAWPHYLSCKKALLRHSTLHWRACLPHRCWGLPEARRGSQLQDVLATPCAAQGARSSLLKAPYHPFPGLAGVIMFCPTCILDRWCCSAISGTVSALPDC
jgi:hypothetical protein